MRKELNFLGQVFTILSIIVGIASIISLIQRWGDVRLWSFFADAINMYREVVKPLKSVLFDWWLEVPFWLIDIICLWSVSIAAILRSDYAFKVVPSFTENWKDRLLFLSKSVFYGPFFYIRILVAVFPNALKTTKQILLSQTVSEFSPISRQKLRVSIIWGTLGIVAPLFSVPIAVALFFALNSFLISG